MNRLCGAGKKQLRQAAAIGLLVCGTSVAVMALAGLIAPLGFAGLPLVAGLMAAVFGRPVCG